MSISSLAMTFTVVWSINIPMQFGEGVVEMGPLSSPVATSHRLPIITIGLSLTVFAVLQLVTDRQTDRQ